MRTWQPAWRFPSERSSRMLPRCYREVSASTARMDATPRSLTISLKRPAITILSKVIDSCQWRRGSQIGSRSVRLKFEEPGWLLRKRDSLYRHALRLDAMADRAAGTEAKELLGVACSEADHSGTRPDL